MRRKATLAAGVDADASCHNEIIENSVFWGDGDFLQKKEYLLLINSIMKSQHFSDYFPV